MAYHGRYPASSATARAPNFPTPPQGTTFSATVAASDPISSESSPSRGVSSLVPDMADLRSAHNRRLSASSHGVAVPEGSAALFPRRLLSSCEHATWITTTLTIIITRDFRHSTLSAATNVAQIHEAVDQAILSMRLWVCECLLVCYIYISRALIAT